MVITPGWSHGFAQTNGIRIHYVEQGTGFPVLLVHGFPELWYSWRYQLPALASAGYHAIAPDLRGYGETDKPDGVEEYDIHHLIDDLTGLLDAVGEERAVIAGHDWGGIIVWQMALMRPERVAAVIGLNTPYQGRGPERPTDSFKRVTDGRFNYILQFQERDAPEQRMSANVDQTFRDMMGRTSAATSFWTDDVQRVYVDAFTKGGFTGPINFYRNMDRNWETTTELVGKQVMQPSLMITAENDPILKPEMARNMDRIVPNLRTEMVRNSGHWTQQEQPEAVNALMIDFLRSLDLRK